MTRYVHLDCQVEGQSQLAGFVHLTVHKRMARIPRAEIAPGTEIKLGKPLIVSEACRAATLEAAHCKNRRRRG